MMHGRKIVGVALLNWFTLTSHQLNFDIAVDHDCEDPYSFFVGSGTGVSTQLVEDFLCLSHEKPPSSCHVLLPV